MVFSSKMKCELCKKEISNYQKEFNELELDEDRKVNICLDCVDKFMKWQQNTITNLFPTKTLKKRLERKK